VTPGPAPEPRGPGLGHQPEPGCLSDRDGTRPASGHCRARVRVPGRVTGTVPASRTQLPAPGRASDGPVTVTVTVAATAVAHHGIIVVVTVKCPSELPIRTRYHGRSGWTRRINNCFETSTIIQVIDSAGQPKKRRQGRRTWCSAARAIAKVRPRARTE
jgi:hypothetical protein